MYGQKERASTWGAGREVCTHSKSLVMPYLWQLLHPNCSLLGCCFLASSHFLSISLPTSSATSVRQRSASVGLGRALLPWHGWRAFPEPAGLWALFPAPPVSPGEQRGAVNAAGLLLAPGLWVTCTARLPLGAFPAHSWSPLCQLCASCPGIRELHC